MNQVSQIWVDLFCGGGGTTTGLETAVDAQGNKIADVAYCINHDPKAIKSHAANYPHCKHAVEDVRTAALQPIKQEVNHKKQIYPKAVTCLWASMECTNFSKAKGGKPREADSRTLAHSLYRYIDFIDFDFIYIENVQEFMSWGELDEKGKPISKQQGKDYIKWVKEICSRGYNYDWKLLNCADYGVPTTRVRYFGIFAKKGFSITFPQPTHSKVPKVGSLFNSELKKWRPVKECLDFTDEGNCIFDRKTPLSERTLERIYAGLVKYVAGGKPAFIQNYYSGNPDGKVSDIDSPCGTLTTIPHQGIVKASFMPKFLSNNAKTGINAGCDVNKPCPTVTTQGRIGLAQAFMVQNNFDASGRNPSLDEPSRTLTASGGQLYLCKANFLFKYFSGVHHSTSIDEPASTLTTKDRLGKVHCDFLTKYYKTGDNIADLESPSPTLTTKDRLAKVHLNWIDKQYGKGGSHTIDEPAATITNTPKLNLVDTSWVLNTQYQSIGRSIDEPCFTLIARMDKTPPYLITTEGGNVMIQIGENDSGATVKIKKFMSIYGIFQIKMRMLKVQELKLITGFPANYVLEGSQADQKKYIGNAVPPGVVKSLSESLHYSIQRW